MASTIYYGKSITEGSIAEKKVILVDSDFESLKPGDILSVYFAQGNIATAPTLVLYINDINQERAISGDYGHEIYNGSFHAESGAWADGEVVNFSYTSSSFLTDISDREYFWEITSKAKATENSYGLVQIDGNSNSSAVSLGKLKQLIAGSGSCVYESTVNEGMQIGTFKFTDYEGQETRNIVQIPLYPDLPVNRDLSNYDNSNSQFITNTLGGDLNFTGESKKLKIKNDNNDYIPVIDLDNETHCVEVTSQADILLIPEDAYSIILGDSTTNTDTYVENCLYVKDTIDADNGIFNTLTTDSLSAENLSIQNLNPEDIKVNESTLDDYIDSRIQAKLTQKAANIFGSNNIKWKWLTSKNYSLDAGKYNYDLLIGDFAEEGYRVAGILSWENFHNENASGTAPWNINIYGFYWSQSSVSNKYDVLHAKVYNCGNTKVTNNKVQVCALLIKSPVEVVLP